MLRGVVGGFEAPNRVQSAAVQRESEATIRGPHVFMPNVTVQCPAEENDTVSKNQSLSTRGEYMVFVTRLASKPTSAKAHMPR
ncbi:UNVERIFIED_CONTAM: hypothetical protein Slati_2470100 [Sesamum latifolium]|uniref:Uncharacterized protein n=1 Tax=Sesamum latifolium TaxID=2727402 RepID=A0AAW2WIR5_9LAMI